MEGLNYRVLPSLGKILVMIDEGHDVSKFENEVVCYTKIIEFFKKYLQN